ncbi:MAG TPA: DMT family transporter [Acidimicrobiales bacterium]
MVGTALAVAAAVSYGVTIVCNRELATRGFGPTASLSVRFGVAALATFLVLLAARRPLLPAPGERWRPLALGAIGYAVESALFYSALERGTAAAVALLFYAYPAIVAVIELASGRLRPSPRLLGALALSVGGTVLIVVAGSRVEIAVMGVVLALSAAASFAVYLLVSSRVVPKTDSLTNGAWVALGASLSLTIAGLATGGLRAPGSSWWLMLINGVATGSAFTLLFAALKRMGASRTAIVMTMEAFSAVVLGALLLGERLGPLQAAGGAAILGATVLISSARAARSESTDVEREAGSDMPVEAQTP